VWAEGGIEPGLFGRAGKGGVEPVLTDPLGALGGPQTLTPLRRTKGQMSLVHSSITSAAHPITVSTPGRRGPEPPDPLGETDLADTEVTELGRSWVGAEVVALEHHQFLAAQAPPVGDLEHGGVAERRHPARRMRSARASVASKSSWHSARVIERRLGPPSKSTTCAMELAPEQICIGWVPKRLRHSVSQP
jgi:hypothetical protein